MQAQWQTCGCVHNSAQQHTPPPHTHARTLKRTHTQTHTSTPTLFSFSFFSDNCDCVCASYTVTFSGPCICPIIPRTPVISTCTHQGYTFPAGTLGNLCLPPPLPPPFHYVFIFVNSRTLAGWPSSTILPIWEGRSTSSVPSLEVALYYPMRADNCALRYLMTS